MSITQAEEIDLATTAAGGSAPIKTLENSKPLATPTSYLGDVSEAERLTEWKSPLRGKVPDVRSAYYDLLKKNFDSFTAQDAIARYLAEQGNGTTTEEYNRFFSNYTPAEVIGYYTGIEDPGSFLTAVEKFAREGTKGAVASGVGIAAGKAAELLTRRLPFGRSVAQFLSTLGGGALGYAGATAVENEVIPSKGVTPDNYPAEKLGGVAGMMVGTAPLSVAALQTFGPMDVLRNQSNSVLRVLGNSLALAGASARVNPGLVAMQQQASAFPAGLGSYAAENIAPGNEALDLALQTIGGFLSPVRGTAAAAASAKEEMLPGLAGGLRVLPGVQENMVASALYKSILENQRITGETPEAVLNALKQPLTVTDPVTGATQTIQLPSTVLGESLGLTALRNYIQNRAGISSTLKNVYGRGYDDAIQALHLMVKAYSSLGTDDSLKAAAEINKVMVGRLLDDLIATSLDPAVKAGQKLMSSLDPTLTLAQREAAAGNFIFSALSGPKDKPGALQLARRAENKAWEDLGLKDKLGSVESLTAKLRELQGSIVDERHSEFISNVVTRYIDRKTSTQEASELGQVIIGLDDLKQLRTSLLEDAASQNSKGEFGIARSLGQLAEAALQDLDRNVSTYVNLPNFGGMSLPVAGSTQVSDLNAKYLYARELSKQLNDKFSRSFVGDLLETGSDRGLKIPPELIAETLGSAKDSAALQKVMQIRSAFDWASSVVPPQEAQKLVADKATVDNYLDMLFRNFVTQEHTEDALIKNPVTGVVTSIPVFSKRGLDRFRKENERLLSALPELSRDLENVDVANKALVTRAFRETAMASPPGSVPEAVRKLADDFVARSKTDEYYSQYLGVNDLKEAFALALAQKKEVNFRVLLKPLVDKEVLSAAPGAIPGTRGNNIDNLRASILDNVLSWAESQATNSKGQVDFGSFYRNLFQPIDSQTGRSVIDILSEPRYGVLNSNDKNNLSKIFKNIESINYYRNRADVPSSDVLFADNMLENFLIRFAGANVGSSLPGAAPSLQTASMGVRIAQKVFEYLPAGNAHKLLASALEPTPEGQALLTKLLERAVEAAGAPPGSNVNLDALSAVERTITRIIGSPLIAVPAVTQELREAFPEAGQKVPLSPRLPVDRLPMPPRLPEPPAVPGPAPVAPPPQASTPVVPPPPPAPPVRPRPGQQGSATSPEERQRFAALFPGDIVSSMIR